MTRTTDCETRTVLNTELKAEQRSGAFSTTDIIFCSASTQRLTSDFRRLERLSGRSRCLVCTPSSCSPSFSFSSSSSCSCSSSSTASSPTPSSSSSRSSPSSYSRWMPWKECGEKTSGLFQIYFVGLKGIKSNSNAYNVYICYLKLRVTL